MTDNEYQHKRAEEARGELELRNLDKYGFRYFSGAFTNEPPHQVNFRKPTSFAHTLASVKTREDRDAEEEA